MMQNNLVGQLRTELLGNQAYCWIGISDQEQEGQYVYQSSQQAISFTNWGSWISNGQTYYEPNGNTIENCVDMKPTFIGQWGDIGCSNTKCFICEKPLLL